VGEFILLDTIISIGALVTGSIDYAGRYSYLEAFTIGILALIGGILVLKDRAIFGVMILIMGIMGVTLGLIGYFACATGICPYIQISDYSFVAFILGMPGSFFFIFGIIFEAILMLIGGILVVSSKDV